jgi:hypothetical protein
MKIKFRGWSRAVYPHNHEVIPLTGGPNRRHPEGKADDALHWDSALSARGRINGLALTGDFLVEFQFNTRELRNWLSVYVTEHPEEAVRLLSEMKAEALIHLIASARMSE